MTDFRAANDEARRAWDHNAPFWDARMGEGNDFVDVLIWPATEKLLAPRQGEQILDIACGNGLSARRLARAGANVVAFDFSEAMIAIARTRDLPTTEASIEYSVLGAILETAFAAGLVLDGFEERAFPAAHLGGSFPLSWSGRFSEIPPILVMRMIKRPS